MSSTQYVQSSQCPSSDDQLVIPRATNKFYPDIHCNLVSFLSLVQRLNIDIVPITWNALDAAAQGGTAKIYQSTVDVPTDFAYKRTRTSSLGIKRRLFGS